MLTVAETDVGVRQRRGAPNNSVAHETDKNQLTEDVQISGSDLSEQIKAATKDSHVRAENTELMLNYQRGQITLPQYKLLLFSLYEIYNALEEELDRNASHPSVAPIYFPQELARQKVLEKDLEHFYGEGWRDRVIVPAATQRYTHRLRQIGKENPEYLVAHAYTRYLGDLSGGQVLGRITQKTLGLKDGEGLSFFSFPGVTSPNRFKQLYRSRMNSIELTVEERKGVLEEAVRAFEFNIEVFNDLQKILSFAEKTPDMRHRHSALGPHGGKPVVTNLVPTALVPSSLLRLIVGVCVALATVGIGIYTF